MPTCNKLIKEERTETRELGTTAVCTLSQCLASTCVRRIARWRNASLRAMTTSGRKGQSGGTRSVSQEHVWPLCGEEAPSCRVTTSSRTNGTLQKQSCTLSRAGRQHGELPAKRCYCPLFYNANTRNLYKGTAAHKSQKPSLRALPDPFGNRTVTTTTGRAVAEARHP